MTVDNFWQWFNEERQRRSLSIRQVEKRGGLSHGSISQREGAGLPPTIRTCQAIARAFNIPLSEVLHRASLIPRYDEEPIAQQLLHSFSQLSEEEQEYVVTFTEALAEKKRKAENE